MNDYPKVLKDFLNYMSTIKGASDLTVKEYGYDISLFLKYIKALKTKNQVDEEILDESEFLPADISLLESVSLAELYSYLSYLDKAKNNAPRTRARKISSLRSFYDYLVNKTEQISTNPTEKLDTPKSSKNQPVYLTLAESVDLLTAIEDEENDFIRTRDYTMVTLFLNLGLRLSELRSIDIDSIKDRTLRIFGKGNKERTIYLNDACQKAITSYMVYRPDLESEAALFLSTRNKRISSRAIQYRIEKYIKKIGLDPKLYSVHKLRHTAATLMHKYGNTDIRTLQSILGHESVATTQIYTHVDDEKLEEALISNPLNNL